MISSVVRVPASHVESPKLNPQNFMKSRMVVRVYNPSRARRIKSSRPVFAMEQVQGHLGPYLRGINQTSFREVFKAQKPGVLTNVSLGVPDEMPGMKGLAHSRPWVGQCQGVCAREDIRSPRTDGCHSSPLQEQS